MAFSSRTVCLNADDRGFAVHVRVTLGRFLAVHTIYRVKSHRIRRKYTDAIRKAAETNFSCIDARCEKCEHFHIAAARGKVDFSMCLHLVGGIEFVAQWKGPRSCTFMLFECQSRSQLDDGPCTIICTLVSELDSIRSLGVEKRLCTLLTLYEVGL